MDASPELPSERMLKYVASRLLIRTQPVPVHCHAERSTPEGTSITHDSNFPRLPMICIPTANVMVLVPSPTSFRQTAPQLRPPISCFQYYDLAPASRYSAPIESYPTNDIHSLPSLSKTLPAALLKACFLNVTRRISKFLFLLPSSLEALRPPPLLPMNTTVL